MENLLNKRLSFMSFKNGDEFLVNGFLKTVVATGWGPEVGCSVKADDGKYYHDSMLRDGLDVTFSADFQISRRAAIAAVYSQRHLDDKVLEKIVDSLKNVPTSGIEDLNGHSCDLINREQAFDVIRSIEGLSAANQDLAVQSIKGMLIWGEKTQDEKRVFIAKEKGIDPVIDTPAHPAFRLELIADQYAVYCNPGDDVRVVDLTSKKILDHDTGVKRYNEIMDQITFEGKHCEFDSVYIGFLKQHHAQFHKKPSLASQIQSAVSRSSSNPDTSHKKDKTAEPLR